MTSEDGCTRVTDREPDEMLTTNQTAMDYILRRSLVRWWWRGYWTSALVFVVGSSLVLGVLRLLS